MTSNYRKLFVVLPLLTPATLAAQVDTSEWKCELCPFADGYRSEYTLGASYVSDDATRFGNTSGYDESGPYVLLDGDGHYDSSGFQANWYLDDLGLASREVLINAGRQGSYGVYAGYRELPYREFDTTQSIYRGSGLDVLSLPPGWLRAGQTTGFDNLATALAPRDIENDRRTMSFGGHFKPVSSVRLFADYRHQVHEGIDVVAGSVFSQAAFLPRVFDFSTDTVDLGARYARGPLAVTLAWYGSYFENQAASLTWDTPFSTVTGAERGRIALEPDNEFQQLTLAGSYRIDSLPTVIAFSAATGKGEQNQSFIPYTINPNLNAGTVPRASLEGDVATSNYALSLTSRPLDKLRIRLSYRFDERDNRTRRAPFTRVIVDRFVSGETELNTPYSFERSRLSVSGNYDWRRDIKISAGYDRSLLDRDFQEVAEQTEESGWGKLRWRANDWIDVHLKGGASRRDIDRYDLTVAATLGQNPLLRKYNLAYRYREYGELSISASPPESRISVSLSAQYADDRYTESRFGLTDSDQLTINADVNYTLSERASIYLLAGHDAYDAMQTGSALFSEPDWRAAHEDQFNHFGGGFRITNIGERTDVSLDYTHSAGETRIRVADLNGGGNNFPDLESALDSLRVKLNQRRSDRLDINLFLRYERFSVQDWALAGGDPAAVPTLLTLGADPYDYNVWVIGLGFRYLTGARNISFPE